MAVGSSGTAISGDILVGGNALSLVVQSKGLANWFWNTVVGFVESSSNSGLEGSAVSVAWNSGSSVDLSVRSVHSDVAVEWSWHGVGVWVEASVAVTATSGNSWLDGGTGVADVELLTN